jgi:hypothetical protein
MMLKGGGTLIISGSEIREWMAAINIFKREGSI